MSTGTPPPKWKSSNSHINGSRRIPYTPALAGKTQTLSPSPFPSRTSLKIPTRTSSLTPTRNHPKHTLSRKKRRRPYRRHRKHRPLPNPPLPTIPEEPELAAEQPNGTHHTHHAFCKNLHQRLRVGGWYMKQFIFKPCHCCKGKSRFKEMFEEGE